MDNFNVPTHQAHLQTQNSRVAAFVQQDELDSVTVSHPNKALAEDILAALVDGVIPGKSLAQMRMKPDFIATSFRAPKQIGHKIAAEPFLMKENHLRAQ